MPPRKCVVCNTNYNLVKQLSKISQLLWHMDGYIKDAKKDKDKEAEKYWQAYKKDCMKNAETMKALLIKRVKANKFM